MVISRINTDHPQAIKHIGVKKIIGKTPLLNKLLEYGEEKTISFHTPGHKAGNAYKKKVYKKFKDQIMNMDTSEIPGLDNLHNPQGIISKAQDRAAEVFKSEGTFFLVNGSTSGIYAMIMAATCPGDKIIIGRNCHQSVINASILADLVPLYLLPQMDKKQGIALGISPQELENTLLQHPDAKAVIITYPTYHGLACDLKTIAELVHRHGKILLVDEAHGAHLGLSNKLPKPALACGADAVVQSIHKSLPSFTQSSMLHIQGNRIDRDKLKFMLRVHQSSSPSYLLMASLDLATTIYQSQGKELMEKLLYNINVFKEKLKGIEGIDILGRERVGRDYIKAIDTSKLWISMEKNRLTGYDLERKLREKFKIQVELSNIYGVLALTSISNEADDFKRLYNALNSISKFKGKTIIEDIPSYSYSIPRRKYTPRQALYMEKTRVKLEDSIGQVSGDYLIPYPPGIPILIPGELIEEEMVVYIREMVKMGAQVLGLRDKKCQWIEII